MGWSMTRAEFTEYVIQACAFAFIVGLLAGAFWRLFGGGM